MVYACSFAPISQREVLAKKYDSTILCPIFFCFALTRSLYPSPNCNNREFADSKTLTAERRDQLFAQIQADDTLGYLSDAISAADISGAMLSKQKVSLNVMAADSTCKLIRTVLEAGVNLHEIYVDTVGDADHYKKKLSHEFPGIQFTVCPKADALYPIVSAASIVAKVTRDRAVDEKAKGSGYPGDPTTKAWLEANIHPVFGYTNDVRFSWSTCVTLMEKECCAVEWECEDEGAAAGQQSLAAMMRGDGKKMRMRHSYFRTRKLQRVVGSVW